MISMIAALTLQRVIGYQQHLPWYIPADLRYFRRMTLNKTVVMGRMTWDSLGQPLAQRRNIVLSHNPNLSAQGAEVITQPEAILALPDSEIMIIGGGSLYRLFLPHAERLYLTYILAEFNGDTWFPVLPPGEWHESKREEHPSDALNPYAYRFTIWDRIRGQKKG
jgi:dihydrofolate reductase